MKANPSPWLEFLDESPHKLWGLLEKHSFESNYAYSLLKEPLHNMIYALYFNSQSRWGIQNESQEICTLAFNFLDWMQKQKNWSHFDGMRSGKKTCPLYYFLSRQLCRFRHEHPLISNTRNSSEPSYSSRRSLLELPFGSTQIGTQLIDAFSSLTYRLPDEIRLSYQLHLEGLLNHEISALLGLNEKTIEEHIQQSKNLIRHPNSWRNVA